MVEYAKVPGPHDRQDSDGMSLRPPASAQQSQRSSSASRGSSQRPAQVRKINDYIVFLDEVIGKGSFGTVVKAQKAADLIQPEPGSAKGSTKTGGKQTVRSTVDPSKTIYACKIFDTETFSEESMQIIFKEVKINNLVNSDYCVRHIQTIKTAKKIYMIQEYANCFDLACLMEQRG